VLAGCVDPIEFVADPPKIAGNTFASGAGDEAVLVTVSYDFAYVDEVVYSVSEDVSAAAWLFANRRSPSPEQFFQIHFVSHHGDLDLGSAGEFIAPLSKAEFELQTQCVTWDDDALDIPIARYVDIIKSQRFDASAEVLVGFFHIEPGELPDKSIELVYVEDIVRSGFACADLQAEDDGGTPEGVIFLEQFSIRARRSFDIVG
jgi:hypothetical protein